MSRLFAPLDIRDGLGYADPDAGGLPVFQQVHVGSRMRNLGDLLLTLPAHALVNITWQCKTHTGQDNGTITFKAMARDIPFGHESESRTTRRFTNLDGGWEFMLHVDETDRVLGAQLLGPG